MKWLILFGAICAAVVALQILIWERRGGRRRQSTLRRLALAVLTVVVFCAAVYGAHWLGIFSVPLVAIAFVPFGVGARWLVLATRDTRMRAAEARAAAAPAPSRRSRLFAAAELPLLVVLALVVVALSLLVGTLVAPH